MKRISVCIASYNGARFIKEQLESILCQLSGCDEIIISDDGSTDDTLAIIDKIQDSRIKVFENKTVDHGVVPNFENALKHASGEYIFLCDQDDVWCPNKVTVVLDYLSEYDFVVHNALIVDSNGMSKRLSYFDLRHTKYGYLQNLWKMRYLGCCMVFRKKCLDSILPFPRKILWHDMWIALILHLKYKGCLIHENLINYRRHGDNASSSTENSGYSMCFRFQYRYYMFVQSILRAIKVSLKK